MKRSTVGSLRGRFCPRRLAGLVAALTLVVAACTQEEDVETRDPTPEAQSGGILTVGITEPRSIDPPAGDPRDPAGSVVIQTMCDRLIELDPVTGEPKPAIARSWLVSDGGDRMTIQLRRGVRFHDGSELVAEDVIYSLSRIAERDFASPSAALMRPVGGFDQVHGDEEVDDDRFRRQLRGLRVIERFSFEIQLNDDRSDFFLALAHVAASPVPRETVERDPVAFAQEPACTGPYRLAQPWEPGDESIRLERFEDYYGENTAYTRGGVGYPDVIEFRIYPDRETQLEAFREGAIDVAHVPEDADLAEQEGARVVSATTPTLQYLGLPIGQEPFDLRGVRIALSQAIDRETVIERVYGGRREPASGMLPPAAGDFYREDACGDHAPATGDVERARETLRSAGVDLEGEAISLYFNDEFDHARLVEAIAEQWENAFGLEVTPVGMRWEEYLNAALQQPGFDGPFRMSWSPQYIGPDQYLHPLFHSEAIGRSNYGRFSNSDFDRSLERGARRAVSEEDLSAEYEILEDMVCGDMPIIPINYGARVFAVKTSAVDSAIEALAHRAHGTILMRELYVR